MIITRAAKALYDAHQKLKDGKDEFLKPLVFSLPNFFTPNKITLIRLVLSLVWLMVVIFYPRMWLIIIFFVGYFGDLLDGAVARLRNKETFFGEYFDAFSDRLNHAILFLLLIKLFNYQITTFYYFLVWDFFVAAFTVFEYFLHSPKTGQVRTLAQFCVRIALWVVLIWEITNIIK